MMVIASLFQLGSQVLFLLGTVSNLILNVACMVGGFGSGGYYSIVCIIVTEYFGIEDIGKTLGFMFSAVPAGILLYRHLLWSFFGGRTFFLIALASAGASTALALASFIKNRKTEDDD